MSLYQVVTWATPQGHRLDICRACEERHKAGEAPWPRHRRTGEEYCTVSMGQHRGSCDSPLHPPLPSRLKEARHDAGLTQVEVSERTGITQGNVSEYETGSRSPELATLTRLADVYGVSLDWLVGRAHMASREP